MHTHGHILIEHLTGARHCSSKISVNIYKVLGLELANRKYSGLPTLCVPLSLALLVEVAIVAEDGGVTSAATRVVLVADELLPRATVAFGDGGVVELFRWDTLQRLRIAWEWNDTGDRQGLGSIPHHLSHSHTPGKNGEDGGEESRDWRWGWGA